MLKRMDKTTFTKSKKNCKKKYVQILVERRPTKNINAIKIISISSLKRKYYSTYFPPVLLVNKDFPNLFMKQYLFQTGQVFLVGY